MHTCVRIRLTMKKDESAWRWIIVASCFWLGFITDGTQFSFGLLFIEFLGEFQQSKATTAWIGSLFLGWLMLGPVVSKLINKCGCRAVVVTGALLTFIGLVVSVFSTSIYVLYVSYGCFGGLGFLLMSFPRKLMIISYFERRRSLAMGISTSGSGIGTIVFNPLTKWLIDVYGWRGTLLIEAGLTLNCVACGLVMLPFVAQSEEKLKDDPFTSNIESSYPLVKNSNRPNTNLPNGIENTPTDVGIHEEALQETQFKKEYHQTDDKDEDENGSRKNTVIYRSLLKSPRMIILLIIKFFEGLAFYTPFTFLPDMAIHKGWSRNQAAWLMTLIGIVNTICRVPIGRIADLKCANRVVSLGGAFIFMGIVSVLMPFTVAYKVMVAECIVFAMFVAAYVVLCSLATADLFEEEELTDVFGVTCLVFGVGSLVSGPVSGALFDTSGDYRLTFVCAGSATIFTGFLCCCLFYMTRLDKKQ